MKLACWTQAEKKWWHYCKTSSTVQ